VLGEAVVEVLKFAVADLIDPVPDFKVSFE
jgi:hypothetical protein